MKYVTHLYFCKLICFLILASCNNSGENKFAGRIVEVNPEKIQSVRLSQLFSEVEFVCTEMAHADVVYTRPEKLIVKDDIYYMKAGHMIIVCNQAGDLISLIDKRGNGPGEYLTISDFQVDGNGDIWLNDREGRKLLKYSKTGVHLKTSQHKLLAYNFFLDDAGKFYLNSGNLLNSSSQYRINVWDEQNNKMIQHFLEQNKGWGYISVLEMTNFSCFADTLSYSQSFSNTIWHLAGQKAIPRLQIDFGKHNMPKDFVEQHTNLRSLAAGWAKSSYATRIDDYCEGERYLFFTYAYNGRQPFVYWFKDKDVVLQFDEFEDDLLFPSVSQETNYKLLPILMNEDYVYVSMDAYRFKEL